MDEEQAQLPQPRNGLRAILRIIAYLIGFGIVMLVVGVLVSPLLFIAMPRGEIRPGMAISLPMLATLYLPLSIAVVVFTRYFVIRVDKRPFETFGFARNGSWTAEAWLGLGLGIGLPALMFATSYLAGWTRITGSLIAQPPSRILAVLVQSLIAMIGIAVLEETIVRGYVLQTLKWGFGAISALIASSVFFGLLHLFNPGATFTAFLGTTAAGLFIGYCYLVTRRLWLPIGFHFGWNFALGPILGFPVSGVDIPSWIVQRTSGPTVWTGGRFGPEASLSMLIILLIGTLAVKLATRPSDHSTI